jgi:tRNA(Ile)-lysidine synthase
MIEKTFRDTIIRHAMLQPGDRVLLAVSGGPDSTAMLSLCRDLAAEMRLDLHVAHLNHGWRGAQSARDAEFVRRMAFRHGMPVTVGQVKPSTWSGRRDRQSSREALARDLRRAFLLETARQIGARRIALGHTRDDQAESFLLRLLRGSGARGLAGIYPVVDGVFIRPLIDVRRHEIMACLKARRLRYRIDATNRDTRLTRNRVRRRLMPFLQRDFNPSVIDALSHAADILRDEETYLEEVAAATYEALVDRTEPGVALPTERLRDLPPALQRRVLRMAFAEVRGDLRRITWTHAEQALQMLRETRGRRSVSLPDDLLVRLEGGALRVGAQPPRAGEQGGTIREALCPVPGEIFLPSFDLRLRAQLVPADGLAAALHQAGSNQAYLDADLMFGPLLIRPRRAGDRFVPLGAPGSRRVKSFLIDRKIPVDERGMIPLVLSGDRIAWIVGHQIDDRFKVTANTRRILLLEKESR